MPPPRDLHPVATGAAKSIVDAHQDPQPLILYSGWFCPFVQRAWLVLEEKKIPYQYVEVNPYSKPRSLLNLNPRGLRPETPLRVQRHLRVSGGRLPGLRTWPAAEGTVCESEVQDMD
ncbi:MAG: hypothetical protein Q9218_003490 [Villophora microphyllina]